MTGSSSASADSAPDPVSAPEPPDDGIALEPPASLPRPARSTRSAQRRPSRRTVLRAAGAGGAALLVGAGAVGARGAANGVWNAGQGAPYELWESWREADGLDRLVAAATLAANPHNIQPWSFTVGEGVIDLYADPQRAMPVNDPDGRERAAGYGCAIENLTLAARYDGYRARVALWPDGGPGVSGPDSADGIDGTARADHVARVVIDTAAPPSERERSLVEAIATRRSNRGPYSSQDLDENLLASLTEDVPVDSGTATAELVWVTEAAAMSALASLYVDATQEIADDAEMSAEAFSWFRGDRAGIERHRDGLTLDGQGLDGPTLAAAKILPAQSRESGDSFWVKRTREVHTATARVGCHPGARRRRSLGPYRGRPPASAHAPGGHRRRAGASPHESGLRAHRPSRRAGGTRTRCPPAGLRPPASPRGRVCSPSESATPSTTPSAAPVAPSTTFDGRCGREGEILRWWGGQVLGVALAALSEGSGSSLAGSS